jgi:hypothetical protein
MKILLQDAKTKLYLSCLGVWTENPKLAYQFRHSDQAFSFVRDNKLSDLLLVVKFDHPLWREIIPMPLLVATVSPEIRA